MSVNVNDSGILRKIAGGTLYADLPIGAEVMYEGTAAPSGYLTCDGSTFSQSEYPDLYAVLGSTTLPNRSNYIIRAKYNVLPLDFESIVADMRRSEYISGLRFKNLGTSFTDDQKAKLAAGDLTDFWNGDYWVDETQNITWRIVDNSGIARRKGDTNFDEPSLVIMAVDPLFKADGSSTHYMNDSDTTTGGYVGTKYRSTYRSQCKTMFSNFFGSDHIATRRELMCNAVANGVPSGWAWTDADIELPTEQNMVGQSCWSVTQGDNAYNIGTQWGQFRLFQLAPYLAINISYRIWERDVVSASTFAILDYSGSANTTGASKSNVSLSPYGVII